MNKPARLCIERADTPAGLPWLYVAREMTIFVRFDVYDALVAALGH